MIERILLSGDEINELLKNVEKVFVRGIVFYAVDVNHQLLKLITEKGLVVWIAPEEV